MACNCATKEELDRLYRIYGEKRDNNQDLTFADYVKKAVYAFITICGWIIVFPLMLIGMILYVFWTEPTKRKINVQNFNLLRLFHLGKYARE